MKTTRKSSHRRTDAKADRKKLKSTESPPSFASRPSPAMVDWEVPSDGDIWVERSHTNSEGKVFKFFCSVKTGSCQWNEPPSGASIVVLLSEQRHAPAVLQAFCRRPISPQVFGNMKACKPCLDAKTHKRTRGIMGWWKRRSARLDQKGKLRHVQI